MSSGDVPDPHVVAGVAVSVVVMTYTATSEMRFVTPSYVTTYDAPTSTPEHVHVEASYADVSFESGWYVDVTPVDESTVEITAMVTFVYVLIVAGVDCGVFPRKRFVTRRSAERISHCCAESAAAGRTHFVGGLCLRKRTKDGAVEHAPVGPRDGSDHQPVDAARRDVVDRAIAAAIFSPGT